MTFDNMDYSLHSAVFIIAYVSWFTAMGATAVMTNSRNPIIAARDSSPRLIGSRISSDTCKHPWNFLNHCLCWF